MKAVIVGGPGSFNGGASGKGIDVQSGGLRTTIIAPRYDLAGGGTSLADSGTDTLQVRPDLLIGPKSEFRSVRVHDEADNPFIDFSTSAGQKGLIQMVGTLLDFYAGVDFGMRFRTNGSTTVLQFGRETRLGSTERRL